MRDNHLDEQVAAGYDSRNPTDEAEMASTLAVLTGLASDGPALEFAIGTGRVALPLHERGVAVHGIDFSEPMLQQLALKAGADRIPVHHGDMTEVRLGQKFQLVYLVYNSIMNLTTQAAQVACFRNAAAHLVPGGCFLLEVMVPRLRNLPPGERFQPFAVSDEHLGIDEFVSFEQQILHSHHYHLSGNTSGRTSSNTADNSSDNSYDKNGGPEHHVGAYRWVWPSELDLMAQLAGMQLINRWEDWNKSPFTDNSDSHISVWRLPQ